MLAILWRFRGVLAALVVVAVLASSFLYVRGLQTKVETQREALKAAAGALRTASAAIASRDIAIHANAAQEASDASELASVYKGAARDAFKAGLSACPRRPGEPVGVRDDLRSLWSAGAYRGSVDVSGKPERGH